ncbi:MAG: hypothetical protein ABSF63_12040 [Candidatus Bathyarchaeia archaeon]
MTDSASQAEDKKTWSYAFIILLLVSIWMLLMRLMNSPFLALDFEISLVYLPTVLSGIIAFYVAKKQTRATASHLS